MPVSRREILRNLSLASGGLAFAPFLRQLKAEATGDIDKLPKRFVFVTRSNGIRPYGIAPKGLEKYVNTPSRPGENVDRLIEHEIADYELNESMSALHPIKEKVSIINGLSAGMVNGGGHGAGFGAMGAYNGMNVSIAETVDGAIANKRPGIFKHLGFKLHDKIEAKIDRPSVTAFGPKQPASFYCDPALAYGELFGAIATDKDVQAQQLGDRKLLDFLVDDTRRMRSQLNATEKEKLDHYLNAFQALSDRRVRMAGMKDVLEKVAPPYDDKYTSSVETHRLEAHFDMAAAALIVGLTNVVTIRGDELGQWYPSLGIKKWGVHEIGHIESPGGSNTKSAQEAKEKEAGMTGVEARRRIRKAHFDQIGSLAAKLDAVPEGDGTMLDQTLIVVLSDHGAEHHPSWNSFPFVLIGNLGGKLKNGRYIHYPGPRESGNRTIGNMYTTLLHAADLPRDGFGQLVPNLNESIQKEPLSELMQ